MIERRALVVLVLTAVALGGCGRKAPPRGPDDAFYPRIYPALTKEDKNGPQIDVNGLQSQVNTGAAGNPPAQGYSPTQGTTPQDTRPAQIR